MPDTCIFEGKTTNEAIEKGLKELGVSKADVEIKVLKNEEKRSFFDILAPRVVKVEMKLKENKEEKNKENLKKQKEEINIDASIVENAKNNVVEFLDKFFMQTLGRKVNYECRINQNVIEIIINEKGTEFLIGYRGETLNALQSLLIAIALRGSKEKIRVELDILGYREKRKVALEELAEKIAKSVIRTRKSITLEPMPPYERKIIHTKLQDNPNVKTVSVGEGMHRRVVISLR